MPRTRTSLASELLVELRREDPAPLHHQLEQELRAGDPLGRLAADTALPSSRALAEHLGLSRGVVVEAYEQLVAEGYLMSRPGGATRVARRSAAAGRAAATRGDLENRDRLRATAGPTSPSSRARPGCGPSGGS